MEKIFEHQISIEDIDMIGEDAIEIKVISAKEELFKQMLPFLVSIDSFSISYKQYVSTDYVNMMSLKYSIVATVTYSKKAKII